MTRTGRATQVTDENGVSKITQTDAFGRVTTVCELSGDGGMPASGAPVACGTDIAGTGFTTTYSYNPAAFQTRVTQGAQTRVFTTDSLGRQISTQEPESGTTTYSYAYNGTGLLVTRQKPQANQTNSSVLTTTQTQYDALDRPLSVTYSDGTGSKFYNYDFPSGWTNDTQLNVLGRLSQQYAATSSAGPAVENFSYDAMGRIIQAAACRPSTCGKSYNPQYFTYDFAGNMTSATDGTGALIAYSYTPAGETTSVTSPLSNGYTVPLLANVTNGPGGPVSYQYGNGLYGVNRFDGLNRRTGGWVCSDSSSQYCTGGAQRYGYTIIPNGGRVNQVCDTVLGGCGNMGYDSFNRLTARTAITGAPLNESWNYDRYGNRWNQTAAPSGSQAQFAFNPANNQVIGFRYDAAGNLLSDGMHSYSYDAEGNLTLVDGGAAARYAYDAANHRVRTEAGGKAVEWVFNLAGQKVSAWDADTGAVLEQSTYWGAQSLSVFTNNTLYFEHADWLGSKRLLSAPDGTQAGAYGALPFGDDLAVTGADVDPPHFAGLDHDYESGLDHAQYREYSSAQAHWMSPDPYSGSYDWSNPQSLNRYSYVGNNPLSLTDPSGQFWFPPGCPECYQLAVGLGEVAVGAGVGFAAYEAIKELVSLFEKPTFHGSLKPRPNAQPWDEYNIHYGPNIAGALGLPDDTCEFGACGGGGFGFQNTSVSGPWHYGNWCGAGGMGTPINGVDGLCMGHDLNFGKTGADWTNMQSEANWNKLRPDQQKQVQGYNQQLCDGVAKVKIPWWNVSEKTAAWEIGVFFHSQVPKGAQCH